MLVILLDEFYDGLTGSGIDVGSGNFSTAPAGQAVVGSGAGHGADDADLDGRCESGGTQGHHGNEQSERKEFLHVFSSSDRQKPEILAGNPADGEYYSAKGVPIQARTDNVFHLRDE